MIETTYQYPICDHKKRCRICMHLPGEHADGCELAAILGDQMQATIVDAIIDDFLARIEFIVERLNITVQQRNL